MKKLFIGITLLVSLDSFSQVTTGDKSPIIKGAQAKVNYVKSQKLVYDFPEELSPYLAGLIMSNKPNASKAEMDQALKVWMIKYSELKKIISTCPDAKTKKAADEQLRNGNFSGVETLLNIRTNYSSLSKTLPNSYATTGNESPIIIGDYATITYTVNQVIEFQLPEGATKYLLEEIQRKENQIIKSGNKINDLQLRLSQKEEVVKQWVTSYKSLELQLKNSADNINKTAYLYFSRGDLSGALKELEKASGTDLAMAKNRILRAKIMLLQFDFSKADQQIERIQLFFSTSVPLVPSFQNLTDYSIFLIEKKGDYAAAVPLLLKALDSAKSVSEKATTYFYLSACFQNNPLEFKKYLEKGLSIILSVEPFSDSTLIYTKAKLQLGLAYYYSSNPIFNLNRPDLSSSLADSTIKTLANLGFNGENERLKITAYILKAYCSHLSGNLNKAFTNIDVAFEEYQKVIKKFPGLEDLLLSIYENRAQFLASKGEIELAKTEYKKCIDIVRPKVSVSSKGYYIRLEIYYTAYLNLINPQYPDSVLNALFDLENIINPIADVDSSFLLSKSSVLSDIGRIYFAKGRVDSAEYYLMNAYDYFVNHLSMTQMIMPKFSQCLSSLCLSLNARKNFHKSISLNQSLLKTLSGEAYGTQVFQNLVPRVLSNIGNAYALVGIMDSSEYYHSKAVSLTENLFLQYPFLYDSDYAEFLSNYISGEAYNKKYDLLDLLVNRYIENWMEVFKTSEPARNTLKLNAAQHVSNFGLILYNLSMQEGFGLQRKRLIDFAGKYFDKSELFISQATTVFENSQILSYYYQRILFENYALAKSDDADQKRHSNLTCQYLKKWFALDEKIPKAPLYDTWKNQLQFYLQQCN